MQWGLLKQAKLKCLKLINRFSIFVTNLKSKIGPLKKEDFYKIAKNQKMSLSRHAFGWSDKQI